MLVQNHCGQPSQAGQLNCQIVIIEGIRISRVGLARLRVLLTRAILITIRASRNVTG